jgi:hypothetical protein
MGKLSGYAIVNQSDAPYRFQLVSIYDDGSESQPYGSYQTYEAAEAEANPDPSEELPVEDRTVEYDA